MVIEQASTVVTQERDEVNIQNVIDSAKLTHVKGVLNRRANLQCLLLLCNPDIQSDVWATPALDGVACHPARLKQLA